MDVIVLTPAIYFIFSMSSKEPLPKWIRNEMKKPRPIINIQMNGEGNYTGYIVDPVTCKMINLESTDVIIMNERGEFSIIKKDLYEDVGYKFGEEVK